MGNGVRRWAVNPKGGAKLVESDMIDQLEGEGWHLLGRDDVTAKGEPKQMYYPQYDGTNAHRKRFTGSSTTKNILDVEIF